MREPTWEDALRAARKQTAKKLKLIKEVMIEEAVRKSKEEKMRKENGRLKPADPKEYAHKGGKVYVCDMCEHEELKSNVEFGKTYECPVCGGEMFERAAA